MSDRKVLIPGMSIEVPHPFIREMYHGLDEDGPFERMSWRPGVRFEPITPDDYGSFADGIGKQILTVVSLHKPGKYPERVFFTRRWQSPDGREFGKPKLMMKAVTAFRTLIKGYRHHFQVSPLTHGKGEQP